MGKQRLYHQTPKTTRPAPEECRPRPRRREVVRSGTEVRYWATQYRKPHVEGIAVHLLTMAPALLVVVTHGVPSQMFNGSQSRFIAYVIADWPVLVAVVPLSLSVGSIATHVRPLGQPWLVTANPMYGLLPPLAP